MTATSTADASDVRPFGFWTATAMVVGGMIGAGIFVLPAQLAPYGWTGVAAWVVGGGAAMLIALVLAGVAAARPEQPGLMAIVGHTLGPVAGVLVGWGAWVSYWCANAYIALTAVRYAAQFAPMIGTTPLRQALGASAIIAALTWLNLLGLKASGRFQVVTSLLKLVPLVAVVVILAALALAGGEAFTAQVHPPFVAGDLFPAITLAFVAIVGFESASIAAQRVRNPDRNVPRATLTGVALACTLYVLVCSGIIFVLPADEVAASSAPIAMFVERFWGAWAGLAVAGFAVVSTVGCLNVWIMLQSEVPLGLVRGGLLPQWLGRTNAKDIAPVPMVIASALSCALLLAASWSEGAAVMDFMLRLTAASGLWIYAFACASAIVIRTHRTLAIIGLAFTGGALWGAGAEAATLSAGLMIGGLPFYWMRGQRSTEQAPQ